MNHGNDDKEQLPQLKNGMEMANGHNRRRDALNEKTHEEFCRGVSKAIKGKFEWFLSAADQAHALNSIYFVCSKIVTFWKLASALD